MVRDQILPNKRQLTRLRRARDILCDPLELRQVAYIDSQSTVADSPGTPHGCKQYMPQLDLLSTNGSMRQGFRFSRNEPTVCMRALRPDPDTDDRENPASRKFPSRET